MLGKSLGGQQWQVRAAVVSAGGGGQALASEVCRGAGSRHCGVERRARASTAVGGDAVGVCKGAIRANAVGVRSVRRRCSGSSARQHREWRAVRVGHQAHAQRPLPAARACLVTVIRRCAHRSRDVQAARAVVRNRGGTARTLYGSIGWEACRLHFAAQLAARRSAVIALHMQALICSRRGMCIAQLRRHAAARIRATLSRLCCLRMGWHSASQAPALLICKALRRVRALRLHRGPAHKRRRAVSARAVVARAHGDRGRGRGAADAGWRWRRCVSHTHRRELRQCATQRSRRVRDARGCADGV
jgi:hypothetical protein